ncbi:MAG: XRE family transcriptional regulator [Planctomycetota bacterium]
MAERIRSLRKERSWTLEELSSRSEVSRAMLSKIERGEASPTVVVAARIASAFGIGLSDLVEAPHDRQTAQVTPRKERRRFIDSKTGFVRELVSPPFENRRFELVEHILPEGQSTGRLPAYPKGVEKQLVVHRGKLRVRIGDTSHELSLGDGLYFEADIEHEFENRGRGECRYYLVVVAAK